MAALFLLFAFCYINNRINVRRGISCVCRDAHQHTCSGSCMLRACAAGVIEVELVPTGAVPTAHVQVVLNGAFLDHMTVGRHPFILPQLERLSPRQTRHNSTRCQTFNSLKQALMPQQKPHQIFLVTEILEAILLQLPIRELLVTAQRVSHTWKTTADSSKALQQALFLQPAPATSYSERITFNPLLQLAFPPWFRPTHDVFMGKKFVSGLPWTSSADRIEAFMRPDTSWRRMLPYRLAKRTVEFVGKNNTKRGIFETNGRVRFEQGVRMGTLYDHVFATLRKYASSFWLEWDEFKVSIEDEDAGDRHSLQEDEEEHLTVFTHNSWFKLGDLAPPQVGEEFRSAAYEELKIDTREERRGQDWHQGFSQPPGGGWRLR